MKRKILSNNKLKKLPILETRRLLIRPMILTDSELVVRWRNSNHITKFSKNKFTITIKSHTEWFNKTRGDRIDYIIIKKDDKLPIGSVSFKIMNIDLYVVELGKYIGDLNALGKGYAKEATKEWIEFGINWCRFKKIIAITSIDNIINIYLNESLGFKEYQKKSSDKSNWLEMYYEGNIK